MKSALVRGAVLLAILILISLPNIVGREVRQISQVEEEVLVQDQVAIQEKPVLAVYENLPNITNVSGRQIIQPIPEEAVEEEEITLPEPINATANESELPEPGNETLPPEPGNETLPPEPGNETLPPEQENETITNETSENLTMEIPVLETRTYIYAGKERIAMLENEQLSYYHNDYLKSTALMSDEEGNLRWEGEYYPFGDMLYEEGMSNTFTYTGKEKDAETSLLYFGARFYDADTGRFAQPDPVLRDEKSNYAYAENNPVKLMDPDGRYAINPQSKALAPEGTSMQQIRDVIELTRSLSPVVANSLGSYDNNYPNILVNKYVVDVFTGTRAVYESSTKDKGGVSLVNYLFNTPEIKDEIVIPNTDIESVAYLAHESMHRVQNIESRLPHLNHELNQAFNLILRGDISSKDLTEHLTTGELNSLNSLAANEVEAQQLAVDVIKRGEETQANKAQWQGEFERQQVTLENYERTEAVIQEAMAYYR